VFVRGVCASHLEGRGCFLGQPVVARVSINEKFVRATVRAAARVFNEYDAFIRTVIRFRAHDKRQEEDLFQEFFLSLIRKPVPPDVRNIQSYLYRAICNHILDSVRTRDSYHRAVRKYAKEIRIPINSRSRRNAILQEDAEDKDAMIASFARHLQKREAQAFLLRYRDNFSIGEIAAKMGVNARTVSRYLSEGLKRLRETLTTS
jgi:RNA polymerase sigma factor (sigma-70 family)